MPAPRIRQYAKPKKGTVARLVKSLWKNFKLELIISLVTLILSIFGGIFGLILGYVFAFLVSIVTPFAPYISWEILALTLLTTLAVGIIFGIYPALKAASKNPIESLKHYR